MSYSSFYIHIYEVDNPVRSGAVHHSALVVHY